ncbi:hypothetical protein [Nitrosomonas sp. Is37]|uniref:hypothetical protein n=1 Tax=Nitrosomonas sp. Is37 TaxID=3080535 RepID=UPI00294B2AA0|nr:hypothetical protein [Nitrosomonas sp. Is37]MDV6345526.1 hypothetical protein [Nitrosomonas sp. Is37]
MLNLGELKESWNRMSPEEREEYERQAQAKINELMHELSYPQSAYKLAETYFNRVEANKRHKKHLNY